MSVHIVKGKLMARTGQDYQNIEDFVEKHSAQEI